jgi:hypothetical protein
VGNISAGVLSTDPPTSPPSYAPTVHYEAIIVSPRPALSYKLREIRRHDTCSQRKFGNAHLPRDGLKTLKTDLTKELLLARSTSTDLQ